MLVALKTLIQIENSWFIYLATLTMSQQCLQATSDASLLF